MANSPAEQNPTGDVQVRKGWRKGPYNHLLDPLPYENFSTPKPATAVDVRGGNGKNSADAAVATSASSASSSATPSPHTDGRKGAAAADVHGSGGGGDRGGKLTVALRRSWAVTRSSVKCALEAANATHDAAVDAGGDGDGGGSGGVEVRIKAAMLTEAHLVALPFAPPIIWSYIWEIVYGTWELVLYVLVMLLAIMLETNVRSFRAGSDLDRWWVYLYKVVVVCYPAGIMVAQFILLCEYVMRKYLFFRLLSFGLLVQAERRPLWRSWFFVFFMAVWVVLNVWAWWGVIKWWGRNGKSGPEYLSFAVFGVVNVVAFHLLMYYYRLMEEQKRFLKPLQAYLLPEVTLVSELVVKQEMWRAVKCAACSFCWRGPGRFDVEWVRAQGVRVPRTYAGNAEAVEAVAYELGVDTVDHGVNHGGDGGCIPMPDEEDIATSGSGSKSADRDPTAVAGSDVMQAPAPEDVMQRGDDVEAGAGGPAASGEAVAVQLGDADLPPSPRTLAATPSLDDAATGHETERASASMSAQPTSPAAPATATAAAMTGEEAVTDTGSGGAQVTATATAVAVGAAAAAAPAAAVAAAVAVDPESGRPAQEADAGKEVAATAAATTATETATAAAPATEAATAAVPATETATAAAPATEAATAAAPATETATAAAPATEAATAAPSATETATAATPTAEAASDSAAGTAAPATISGPVAEAKEDGTGGFEFMPTADVTTGPATGTSPNKSAATAGSTRKITAASVGAKLWCCCRCCLLCWFRCCCCCCICVYRIFDYRSQASGLFALPATFLTALACHKVWPFRRDIKYMRMMVATMALTSLLVASGIVYGGWLAGSSAPICQWGLDACYDCLIYQEEYVEYDKVCADGSYDISKVWPDPDYFDPNCTGGRSWFTNGVWSNNKTEVAAQSGDYQNVTGKALINGYLAAIMSYYAYADSFEGLMRGFEGQFIKRFTSLFTEYGMIRYEFIFQDDTAIQDTQFIITGTGKDVYMIFRGTDSLADAIATDLRGRCVENTDYGAPTCVHNGFLSAYRESQSEVYQRLLAIINSLSTIAQDEPPSNGTANSTTTTNSTNTRSWDPSQGQFFSLWLTGHSLGGALATLSAIDLRSKGLDISGVFTYGSPRVGDTRFRDLYSTYGLDKATWRYVHRSDTVTQVPPQSFGFVHVTPPYMVMEGRCTIWPDENTCAQSGILGGCAMAASDHFIPGYLGNLRSCVAASHQLPNCTEAMMPLWAQMEGQD